MRTWWRTWSVRLAGVAPLALAAFLLGSGCGTAEADSPGAEETTERPLQIYATTGYLADAAQVIAPGAEVTTMVGPGGDPHTYQPSTRDIVRLREADLVLWNGLNLEAHMTDQLTSLGERQIAVGDHVPADLLLEWPETDAAGTPLHDPHIWNSPAAWSVVVSTVADKLAQIDPPHAALYRTNAVVHQREIAAAAAAAVERLATIPAPRILITGHDAFNYFGQAFDLAVYATDFVSTDAALSATELSELARLIAEEQVPVIFQDNQANPQAIVSLREAVRARGWEVTVSDQELYADSLGAEPGLDSYLGVLSHNVQAVANALGAQQ